MKGEVYVMSLPRRTVRVDMLELFYEFHDGTKGTVRFFHGDHEKQRAWIEENKHKIKEIGHDCVMAEIPIPKELEGEI